MKYHEIDLIGGNVNKEGTMVRNCASGQFQWASDFFNETLVSVHLGWLGKQDRKTSLSNFMLPSGAGNYRFLQ